jgi:hypothetical protein
MKFSDDVNEDIFTWMKFSDEVSVLIASVHLAINSALSQKNLSPVTRPLLPLLNPTLSPVA